MNLKHFSLVSGHKVGGVLGWGGRILVSIIFAHKSGELLPVEGEMESTRSISSL